MISLRAISNNFIWIQIIFNMFEMWTQILFQIYQIIYETHI